MPIEDNKKVQASQTMNKIGDVPLPEGWSWIEPDDALIPGGILTAKAVYGDTANYEQYQVQMMISKEAEIITSATDQNYVIGKDTKAVIKCTGALSELREVKVDGVRVDSSNYTLEEGSTILTFSKDYLDKLSVGTHTVILSYTAGDVQTALTVKEKQNDNPPTDNPPTDNPPTDNPPDNPPTDNLPGNNPQGSGMQNADSSPSNTGAAGTVSVQTGDNGLLGVYVLLLFLSMGMMVTAVLMKRKKCRKEWMI